MKTFKIFQIHLTDAEVDKVNETGDHFSVPKQASKVRMQLSMSQDIVALAKKAFGEGHFSFCGTIEANGLDHCFRVGNIGSEELITRFGAMHSLSVGDLIQDPDGNIHVVASFGFELVVDAKALMPDAASPRKASLLAWKAA